MESGGDGNQPKAQSGKVVSIGEVYVPVRYPEQGSGACEPPGLVGAPATGFKCSTSSASCGAMARSRQDLRLKGPGDSSSGQELRCKRNDRWGSCYQT